MIGMRAWPLVVAGIATLAGFVMLAVAGICARNAQVLIESTPNMPPAFATPAPGAEAAWAAPPYSNQLDDVDMLFSMASKQGLSIGTAEFGTENKSAAGLLVRRIHLRMDDEYPKIKSFLSEALLRMPHLALDEIRAEQVAAPAGRLHADVKLSFSYEGPPAAAAVEARR